ncbi:btk-binding protein-related [Anaeramoeba flamelloides]|uniref:Btk-binding protein-related n=1 Tax=Anaeramoeba flamelloides TaxID=1746091 RepID=A0AAV8AH32_9EUKA|nr:btk-binding protein-related [Anaeramoeba flamelloides]
MTTDILFRGTQKIDLLFQDLKTLPKLTPISKIKKPIKLVTGDAPNLLVLNSQRKLDFYEKTQTNETIHHFDTPDEEIKDIVSGSKTFLILTRSGKVFSLAEGGMLYGSGYNRDDQLETGNKKDHQLPIFLFDKVDRVFGGVYSLSYHFTTTFNALFCSGDEVEINSGRYLQKQRREKFIKVPNWKASDIRDLKRGRSHALILTNEGKVFGCGVGDSNGLGSEYFPFVEIYMLANEYVTQIAVGRDHSLALTKKGEIYCWGLYKSEFPSDIIYESNYLDPFPTKVIVPNTFPISSATRFHCAYGITYIYNSFQDCLIDDFKNLFESKKYCDLILGSSENEIKCHKTLIQSRFYNIAIEKIQQTFIKNEFTKEEINIFLKWIYYEEKSTTADQIVKKILESLNLSSLLNEHSFEGNLLKLYKDEDSKDIFLFIKDDVENEKGEEKKEEKDGIPVHKIIILARSGLFREMFENISENEKKINKIQDYSGKSKESLEILIKYFYTNKIELTNDEDPQIICDDLEDAVEYYQLNENSNLPHELNKIKQQYNLN